MASEANDEASYTIDELAAITQAPSRTIRFYQSKGALPAPTIKGRVAYYGPKHVERLKLIAQLQDRGLSIKAIRDLVRELEKGRLDVNDWLGLEKKLRAPWSEDHAELMTDDELRAALGDGARPGLVGDLLRIKLLRKEGKGYLVASPALLRIAVEIEQAGIDLDLAAWAAATLRKHVGNAAEDLASLFFKNAGKGFGRKPSADELGAAFEALRPVALEAIQLIFGQEMQRVLRKYVESGKTTGIAERKKNAR
jgi:DNA-binding transcriptional MerR regulator